MLLLTVCRCIVADGVMMVCADYSVPAVKVAVLTNKSTAFHTVQLPVSTTVNSVLVQPSACAYELNVSSTWSCLDRNLWLMLWLHA